MVVGSITPCPRYLLYRKLEKLNDVERRKYCTYRDSKSDPSAVQALASRYTYWASPDPSNKDVQNKINSMAFSPQENYTDRVAAACRRSETTVAGIGVSRGQRNGSSGPLISVF
jgi:hypothetical protein